MVDLIKRKIIEKLSEYTTGLRAKDISLQFLTGKAELKNLELNPDFLNRTLMLPPWIEVHRAKCESIKCKVPFTSLRSESITVSINEVLVQVRTCDVTGKRDGGGGKKNSTALKAMQSSGKYGLIDRAIDGMSIVIRTIRFEFADPTFEAQLVLNDLSIFSTAPPGIKAKSLKDMFIRMKEEDTILIYKQLKIQSLRIEAKSLAEGHLTATPIRLLISETIINLSLKRLFATSDILFAKVCLELGDLMWILTQRQLKAMSTLVQNLTEIAIRTFHAEREEHVRNLSKKPSGLDAKGKTSSSSSSSLGGRSAASFLNPANVPKVTEWLQKLYAEGGKAMPAWEVIQHSLHLTSHQINVQLCDDMEDQGAISGTTLLHVQGLSVDVYPDQKAGLGRNHWRNKNEYVDQHLSWSREILADAIKHHVDVSESEPGSTPSSRDTSSLSSVPGSVANLSSVRDSPRGSVSSSSLSIPLEPAKGVSYTATEMDDSDALIIETSIAEDLSRMKSSGFSSWGGSSESLQSVSLPGSPTGPAKKEYSKVRTTRLHERNIVIRCTNFSIDPLSTAEGKVSNLPFAECDKKTFSIPEHYPAFQVGLTLYYYPGHTAGKDHLVPRPVIQVNTCPLHAILNQQTCLWLVDFMSGVLTTVDFNLASRVKDDITNAVKKLKEKRARYPMPTDLEGFFAKISIMYAKITLPIYDDKQELPQDGRPVAVQLETSEIKLSTLTKLGLDNTAGFKEMLEYLRHGNLFSTASRDIFPHCESDLGFLSYDCLFRMVQVEGLHEAEAESTTKVIPNEAVGYASPWHAECNCVTVQFVQTLNRAGLTIDAKPFIKDFPLDVWVFPGLKDFVDSLSSGAEDDSMAHFPTVSAIIHISKHISASLERLEFLSVMRLKDSLNRFKAEILHRMLPMKDKIQEDMDRTAANDSQTSSEGQQGSQDGGSEDDLLFTRASPSAVDLFYASGAVVVPGATFHLILPPIPLDDKKKKEQSPPSTLDADQPTTSVRNTESQDTVNSTLNGDSTVEKESADTLTMPGHQDGVQDSPSDALAEEKCENIDFVAEVSGIEAIFTACHKGITVKAGIHSVAVEESERGAVRAASPVFSTDDVLHSIKTNAVVKVRADLGDIAEEYFNPAQHETFPDALVRVQVEGLDVGLVSKHLNAVQSFLDDEIPADNPLPLDICVKRTKVSMFDSVEAGTGAPTTMNVVVGDVLVNRGCKPKPLYPVPPAVGSVETLADDLVEFDQRSEQSSDYLGSPGAHGTLRAYSEFHCETTWQSAEVEVLPVPRCQDDSVLTTFRTFVEEFQQFVSQPEHSLTAHTSEFVKLCDVMRTTLAGVGVTGNSTPPTKSSAPSTGSRFPPTGNRVPPPDYNTAVQVRQGSDDSQRAVLEKLQKIESENSNLKVRQKDLENECSDKDAQIHEFERMLIDCKMELAQQKEMVLDKDDKLRHLQEEVHPKGLKGGHR